jgi:hypothetical protein
LFEAARPKKLSAVISAGGSGVAGLGDMMRIERRNKSCAQLPS